MQLQSATMIYSLTYCMGFEAQFSYRLPSPPCGPQGLLTFTNTPDLYTASTRFVVAFPLEYSPKVYQSVDRQ